MGPNGMQMTQERLKKWAAGERASYDWPSAVLHDWGRSPVEGIDEARLLKMADLIETLEVKQYHQAEREGVSVGVAKHVDGKLPVLGFTLHSGGNGYGATVYRSKKLEGFWLTGYGLACWAWGESQGMAALAANGSVNAVQDVLSAQPVRGNAIPGFSLGDVTSRHVADAIRQFVRCRDASKAWYLASGLKNVPPKPVARAVPAARPEPKVVKVEPGTALSMGVGSTTSTEQWKTLMVKDEWAAAAALAQEKVADIEAKIDALRAELGVWKKREISAQAMVD